MSKFNSIAKKLQKKNSANFQAAATEAQVASSSAVESAVAQVATASGSNAFPVALPMAMGGR
jgi:hypothetical protein